MIEQTGVIIEKGPMDWAIVQQAGGKADIALCGRWAFQEHGRVQLRVVYEDSCLPVAAAFSWRDADATNADGTWSTTLRGVPAGGLYRIETRFHQDSCAEAEWSIRGDIRHFVGVGDLWVITGQSNSAGYGRDPVNDPPELGIHVFNNACRWALATHPLNDSTDTAHPVNRETANSGHSPYIAFARRLKAVLGYPIGLVQTSLGGSPLSGWNPNEPGDHGLYENMLDCIGKTGGRVRGFVWYQGCADTYEGAAQSYCRRFGEAVASWRKALGDDTLPVVTAQLNRLTNNDGDYHWSIVREQQRMAAHEIPNVAVVPTLDLPLSDFIHNTAYANLVLGARMATAALGMAYGRDIQWRPAEIASAKRTADGMKIELAFDNVVERIASMDTTVVPFAVNDIPGDVPVAGVDYVGGNKVVVRLLRPLQGAATVSAGEGPNPPALPLDVERVMAILAFHAFPVD